MEIEEIFNDELDDYGVTVFLHTPDGLMGETKGFDYQNRAWIVQWQGTGFLSKIPYNSEYLMVSIPGCVPAAKVSDSIEDMPF